MKDAKSECAGKIVLLSAAKVRPQLIKMDFRETTERVREATEALK